MVLHVKKKVTRNSKNSSVFVSNIYFLSFYTIKKIFLFVCNLLFFYI